MDDWMYANRLFSARELCFSSAVNSAPPASLFLRHLESLEEYMYSTDRVGSSHTPTRDVHSLTSHPHPPAQARHPSFDWSALMRAFEQLGDVRELPALMRLLPHVCILLQHMHLFFDQRRVPIELLHRLKTFWFNMNSVISRKYASLIPNLPTLSSCLLQSGFLFQSRHFQSAHFHLFTYSYWLFCISKEDSDISGIFPDLSRNKPPHIHHCMIFC